MPLYRTGVNSIERTTHPLLHQRGTVIAMTIARVRVKRYLPPCGGEGRASSAREEGGSDDDECGDVRQHGVTVVRSVDFRRHPGMPAAGRAAEHYHRGGHRPDDSTEDRAIQAAQESRPCPRRFRHDAPRRIP